MAEIRRKLVIVGDGACGKVLAQPRSVTVAIVVVSLIPAILRSRPVC